MSLLFASDIDVCSLLCAVQVLLCGSQCSPAADPQVTNVSQLLSYSSVTMRTVSEVTYSALIHRLASLVTSSFAESLTRASGFPIAHNYNNKF